MMKKLLAMFALAVVITGNAYATETNSGNDLMAATQVQAAAAGVVMNSVDMQAAFQQDAQPMQMAALSGQEMKETQGAWRIRINWRVVAAVAIITCNVVTGGACLVAF
ncbi:MAG: hypothetical protein ABL885_15730 [Methylophilaceae bacterium]